MGSTGGKVNGVRGDKREGKKKGKKRERNRLKGRESRFALTGNIAWTVDGCRACGLKQPPPVLWRVFGARHLLRLRGTEGPCSPFPPPEIRAEERAGGTRGDPAPTPGIAQLWGGLGQMGG